MLLRRGTYIVPTNRWYVERTVWLIAGFVLLSSTMLALLINPLVILGVIATGLVSINVASAVDRLAHPGVSVTAATTIAARAARPQLQR